jgi:ABC-type spermidine/putrescine transport system permease subunit I
MLLNRNFWVAFTRAFILLPFIILTVLSTFAQVDVRPTFCASPTGSFFHVGDHRPHQLMGTPTSP